MPMYGSNMWMIAVQNDSEDGDGQPFSLIAEHLEEKDARRIAAALNVLADIPTDVLERTAGRRRQPVGGPA